MSGPSFAEVEASLGAAVRDYLAAEPNPHISEDANLRPVCMWLSRWLRDMLAGKEGWGPYRYEDGILPCTAERSSPTELVLSGLLIWMGDKGTDWKEPLLAKIQLSRHDSSLFRYEVQVGDADRGLGKCPYGAAHDYPYVPVERWLFRFVGGQNR
jgi:hypothetical protein